MDFQILNPHALALLCQLNSVPPTAEAALQNLTVEGDCDDAGFMCLPTSLTTALRNSGRLIEADYWQRAFTEKDIKLIRLSDKDARLNIP